MNFPSRIHALMGPMTIHIFSSHEDIVDAAAAVVVAVVMMNACESYSYYSVKGLSWIRLMVVVVVVRMC